MDKPVFGSEFALTEARWCEPNASKPRPLVEIGYYTDDQQPQIGDSVWLRLESYDDVISAPFWAVYERWTTLLNGMEDEPQDVDKIRLIRCEVISPFENETFWKKKPLEHPGLFQVRCLEILKPAEISQRFPFNEEPFTIDLDSKWDRISRILKQQDFTVYIGGDQGAIWHYIATNEQPRRMVMHQMLVVNENWEICNRPLIVRGDENRILKAMAARQ